MDRFFLKIIIPLCGLWLVPIWISTAQGAELSIPPIRVTSGQTFEVPLMIDQVDNLAGVKVVMKYDASILIYRGGKKTGHTASLMHIINDRKPGVLILVMAGARGIQGKDFPILHLTFTAKAGLKRNHTTRITIPEVQLMSDRLQDIDCTTNLNPLVVSPVSTRNQKEPKSPARP
jgi:hypothetical protein